MAVFTGLNPESVLVNLEDLVVSGKEGQIIEIE